MARLLENQALELLQRGGMPIPRYEVASDPESVRAAAARIGGPVVIKALIPSMDYPNSRHGNCGMMPV